MLFSSVFKVKNVVKIKKNVNERKKCCK